MENDLSLELTKPQMNFLVEVYAFLLDNLFVFVLPTIAPETILSLTDFYLRRCVVAPG